MITILFQRIIRLFKRKSGIFFYIDYLGSKIANGEFMVLFSNLDFSNDVIYYIYLVLFIINTILIILINIFYFHQYFYAITSLFLKSRTFPEAKKNHKYGIIICARDEENQIPQLVDSLNKQNYPRDLFQIFLIADNCTDHTAEIGRKLGVKVYERFNKTEIGKSYALDYVIKLIFKDPQYDDLEAFFVFDADNLVPANYMYEMNKVFDAGYKVSTSMRNSKNFDSSWVAGGQGISFLREALMIHHSRSAFNIGTYISGTGFYVSRDVLEKYNGWPFHTLIEDVEFSLQCALDKIKITYNEKAEFFDEQPVTLKASFNQRLRWCRGTVECFKKYDFKLLVNSFKKRSLLMFELFCHINILPVLYFFYSFFYLIVNAIFYAAGWMSSEVFYKFVVAAFVGMFIFVYLIIFIMGMICMIRYRKHVHISIGKKIFYVIMFPIFMACYIPIYAVALFKKVKWKKISHDDTRDITQV